MLLGKDLNQSISQASCPEAAEHSYIQRPTMLPPAFGTGLQWHSHPCSRDRPPHHPKGGSRSACLGVFICLPFSSAGSTISPSPCLTPARFPAPSCQVYPAFSSSPPPAPWLSGHVCISVSCCLSSPYPPPALAPYSILPGRLRPEPKLASVR